METPQHAETFSLAQFILSGLTGILTAVMTVFKWLGGIKGKLEARMDTIEQTARNLSMRVEVIKVNEVNHLERLQRIEETTRDTNAKIDQLLLRMVSEK